MMGNVVSYLWDGIVSKADGEDSLLTGMFPMRTRWQHEYVKKRALEEDGYKIKDIPVVNGLPPKEENKV